MKTPLQKLLRPHILAIQPYQSARHEFTDQGDAITFMDANENPFDNGVNRYPDPFQTELKAVLASQKGLSPEQIFLSNGSDESIVLLIQLFCQPGEEAILIAQPTFGMYEVAAQIQDVAVKKVPLTTDFQLDVAGLLASADAHTKLLFIPSPNNPTGNDFPEEELKTLLRGFSGLVVLDEAYWEFSDRPSAIAWLDEFPNLVVLQTFSKAQGRAGIRLGMAFAQPELIDYLNRVKLPYNINILTQQSALRALEETNRTTQQLEWLADEKQKLTNALNRCSFVNKCFPSDANFLLIRVDDAPKRYRQFLEAGIVLRNTSKYLHCDQTLRITVGTPDENNALMALLNTLDR